MAVNRYTEDRSEAVPRSAVIDLAVAAGLVLRFLYGHTST